MKLYPNFYLFLFFLFIGNLAQGQIQISGTVDSALTNLYNSQEISIKINNTTNIYDQGQTMELLLDHNRNFKYNIKSPSSTLYISFWIKNKNKGFNNLPDFAPIHFPKRSTSKLQEVYLFESGDEINMDIRKDGWLLFKGKGSAKLNCQFEMYNVDQMPLGAILRMGNLKAIKSINMEDSITELTTKIKIQILNSYKDDISNQIFRLLYLDVIASGEYQILTGLFLWGYTPPIDQNIKAVRSYFEGKIAENKYSIKDSLDISKSGFYADLLFEKEFNSIRLYSKKGNYREGDSFREIYEIIKSKYHGVLRDKLLLICFQKMNEYFPNDVKTTFRDALKIMGNNTYKDLLEKWGNNRKAAYAFELYDEKGKLHKLVDYKGKVVVIDFWFTGCTWCTYLNAAMKTIINKYKANKDVVFFTINIDKNKTEWLKSLATGIYTSPETINLYTNGLASKDPGFEYYNFVGAPHQLIIGKNGEIVSAYPPRSDSYNLTATSLIYKRDLQTGIVYENSKATLSNPNAMKFMKLIDDALKVR